MSNILLLSGYLVLELEYLIIVLVDLRVQIRAQAVEIQQLFNIQHYPKSPIFDCVGVAAILVLSGFLLHDSVRNLLSARALA
jgi:hypothetical protein